MNDHEIADAGLVDIASYDGGNIEESGLGTALNRIFATKDEDTHYGFSSTI